MELHVTMVIFARKAPHAMLSVSVWVPQPKVAMTVIPIRGIFVIRTLKPVPTKTSQCHPATSDNLADVPAMLNVTMATDALPKAVLSQSFLP